MIGCIFHDFGIFLEDLNIFNKMEVNVWTSNKTTNSYLQFYAKSGIILTNNKLITQWYEVHFEVFGGEVYDCLFP